MKTHKDASFVQIVGNFREKSDFPGSDYIFFEKILFSWTFCGILKFFGLFYGRT